MQRELECAKVELEKQQEEIKKQVNAIRSLHSKVDHYKAYVDDSKNETKALMKEKEDKLREVADLKRFLPEYEQIERQSNKRKYLIDMRERCSNEELNGFLYQYALIQCGIQEDLQKKIETIQGLLEQKENKISLLELTNGEMKKQLEQKKQIIKQIKDQGVTKHSGSTAYSGL